MFFKTFFHQRLFFYIAAAYVLLSLIFAIDTGDVFSVTQQILALDSQMVALVVATVLPIALLYPIIRHTLTTRPARAYVYALVGPIIWSLFICATYLLEWSLQRAFVSGEQVLLWYVFAVTGVGTAVYMVILTTIERHVLKTSPKIKNTQRFVYRYGVVLLGLMVISLVYAGSLGYQKDRALADRYTSQDTLAWRPHVFTVDTGEFVIDRLGIHFIVPMGWSSTSWDRNPEDDLRFFRASFQPIPRTGIETLNSVKENIFSFYYYKLEDSKDLDARLRKVNPSAYSYAQEELFVNSKQVIVTTYGDDDAAWWYIEMTMPHPDGFMRLALDNTKKDFRSRTEGKRFLIEIAESLTVEK